MKKIVLFLLAMLFTASVAFGAALSEGFEGTWPPTDWTVIDNDGGSVFNETFTYMSAHGGSQGAQAMGCQDDYLITPKLSPTAGDNTFGYWVRVESSSYDNSFEIMVSTTGTAIGDFTQIADYPNFNTAAWTNQTEDLSTYNGQNIYVAIHVYDSESTYWDFGFDDVAGPELFVPACPKPTDLTTTNITQTTADLGWTEAGSATTWEYDYGLTGYGPPAGAGTSTTSNPVNITGLTAGTTYDWYVRADCGAKEVSDWAGPATFSTDCAPVTTFPYTEGFEDAWVGDPAAPPCWKVVDNNADGDKWYQNTLSTYAHSGTKSATIYTDYNSANDDWLITPAIDISAKTSYRLKFWTRARSSYEPEELQVLLSTTNTDLSSFTNVLMASTPIDFTTYTEYTLSLATYSSTVYIAFVRNQAPADGYYLYLDDVTVEEIPAVPIISIDPVEKDFGLLIAGNTSDPQTFTIGNIGGGTLTIADGDISLTGTDADQFTLTDTNTYPINLTSGQSANVDVSFSPTTKGSKTADLTIVDNRGTTNIPLTGDALPAGYTIESFEGTFPPSGWEVQNIQNNDWIQYGYTAYEGTKCARLSYYYSSGYLSSISRLVTPKLEVSANDTILFYAKKYYDYKLDTLFVQTSTDGTNFTTIETCDLTNVYQEFKVDLSAYAKGNIYVGFYGKTDAASSSYIYLDYVFMPPRHWEAPGTPANPSPADMATGQVLAGPLDWDDCDFTQTYDVYLEDVNPPTVKIVSDTTLSEASYSVPSFGTRYYWQVVAKNPGSKFETPGPIWSFTTIGTCPGLPLTEDFGHGFNNFANAAGNDVDWIMNDTLFVSTSHSAWNPYEASNENILMQTCVLDLTSKVNAMLKFWHIAKTEGNYDECYIEISTDAGVTWAVLPAATYLGASVEYATDGCFWEDSYAEWGTSDIVPENTWWKQEIFNLTSYNTFSQVMIRFRLSSDSSVQRFGWLIDNIAIEEITPEPDPPSSPNPADHATGVSTTALITWVNGFQTETIDLFFGLDSILVDGMYPIVQKIADQDTNSYDPGLMNYATTYYWKVRAKNSNKAETVGPLWRFTTEKPPEPENLTAIATDGQVYLEWQEPLPFGEIRYDDGTAEAWYWVADPSSLDHYFYVKFNAPANGNVTHIAVFNASNGANWNEIMICPDDGTGKPDLAIPYQSFPDVPVTSTIGQGGEWELLELLTPQGMAVGDAFYVVTRWPDGTSTGPFVGTDKDSNSGRSYWTSDAGVTWNAFSYNFIMRAFMSTSKGVSYTLTSGPSINDGYLPVNTVAGKTTPYKKEIEKISHSYCVPNIIASTGVKDKAIQGYKIYRGLTSGSYSYLAFVTSGLTYTDNTASNMTEYFYVVSTMYDLGESGYSNEASGVPMAAGSIPYFSNFDAKDDGGFYGTGDWECGAPTYVDGPAAAYSLPNVWGTKLDTTYSNNSNSWLIQPFDLSAVKGYGYKVNFVHWDSIETNWDYGYVAVDHDNDNLYTLLATYTGYQTTWTEEQVIIPDSLCSAYTKLAFIFTSDATGEYPGFYIDNVSVDEYIPPQISVNPTSFTKTLLQNDTTTDNLIIGNTARGAQDDLVYTANIVFGSKDRTDLVNEEFEGATFPPAGWSVINNNPSCDEWQRNDYYGRTNYAGGSGYCADADADAVGSGGIWPMDTELWTPPLNLIGYTTAAVSFIAAYNYMYGDWADVDISTDGGLSWTNLLHWDVDHDAYGPGEVVNIDLTPYIGNANCILRWYYYADSWDYYYEIDNVIVSVTGGASPWLTLDGGTSVNGTIPVGDSDNITVGFDAAGLDAGIHTADIVITSNDPDNPSVTVPVTLEVAGPPAVDILMIDTGANVKLTWVDEGYTYKVYSSTDPHAAFPGGWTYVTSVSGIGEVTLPTPAVNTFYVVTASDDPPLARPANKVKATDKR